MTYFLHPQEVLLAVEQNEVQLCSFILDLDELDRLSGKSHLKITSKGYQGIGAMLWLAFNLQKKPFHDLRVRQAFAYAIDREFIANTLFHGKAKVATGPISPDSPFYSQNVELYDVDVNKANELLDMAGYQRGPDGKRFTVTMDTLSGAYTLSTAKFLRYELGRKIGVDVRVRAPSNFLEWTERVSNSDFQCTLDVVFNWGDPVIGVHRIYDSRNIRKGVMWTNTQHYKNSEVDALLDAAGSETDIGKRKELYATFQNIVSKELPVYWLMMIPYHTVYHKDLRGIDDNIWGVLSPLDRLYWQKE
jgi:peptide/nickel transport system substrate-binding protein